MTRHMLNMKNMKMLRKGALVIRFSEEPLSLMRETLHNVQGMKAHSRIQFSLDSD